MFAGSAMTHTLPQGATQCANQRSKEVSSHQGSASLEPVLPGMEGPPVECPEGLVSERQQRSATPACLCPPLPSHPAPSPQHG